MSEAGAQKVADFVNAYEIVDTVSKDGTTVTLGRIAACFPTFVAKVLVCQLARLSKSCRVLQSIISCIVLCGRDYA